MDVLKRADREIENGRLWRAREILENAVGHSGYKAKIYEKLGIVLLEMKDYAEAGKYLFLSGVRKPEYDEAINIFLEKYEKKLHKIHLSFPKSARLQNLPEYPVAVADKLRELNYPEKLRDENGNSVIPLDSSEGKLELAGCIFVICLILLLIILGILKLLEIIF